jgi:hypothetical protein
VRYLGWEVLVHDPGARGAAKFLKVETGATQDENLRLMKNFSGYSD